MNKKGNGMGLSQEVLLREAARLAPVLRALRAAKPDISSDALWQGILSQWSEKDLEKALVAFEKSKSLTRFKKLLSPLPQAGPDGFFEAEGEKWGTREVLAKLLGLSRPTIHTHSTHCRMLRGKDVAGHTLKFYAVSDIRKACERLLEHLPKAGSSGFIEADGEEWGTKLAHAKRLKLSIATVARRLKTCRHRYGKNASGARVFFYAFKDIDKACAALLTQMPRAKRDGFFSLSQEIWGTKESIAGVLSVDRSSIEKRPLVAGP
jgi:hypothetical protein